MTQETSMGEPLPEPILPLPLAVLFDDGWFTMLPGPARDESQRVGWKANVFTLDQLRETLAARDAQWTAQLEQIERERDALKLQAQCWASEAKAQRATVQEAYRICTGNTGEPGDWNGAEPIRALAARLASLEVDARRYVWLRDIGDETWTPMARRTGVRSARAIDAAIDAALNATTPETTK